MSTLDRRKVERERMVRAGLVEPRTGIEGRWSEEGMVPVDQFDAHKPSSEWRQRRETHRRRVEAAMAAQTAKVRGHLNSLPPRARSIIISGAEEHNVSVAAIIGPYRSRTFSDPRQRIMARLRREMRWPYKRIALAVGRTDHTTARHACIKLGAA